jgi:hypothetical protein
VPASASRWVSRGENNVSSRPLVSVFQTNLNISLPSTSRSTSGSPPLKIALSSSHFSPLLYASCSQTFVGPPVSRATDQVSRSYSITCVVIVRYLLMLSFPHIARTGRPAELPDFRNSQNAMRSHFLRECVLNLVFKTITTEGCTITAFGIM